MTSRLNPVLPDNWYEENIKHLPGKGCWLWHSDRNHLSWRAARTLIAAKYVVVDDSDCAITPCCVFPLHSRDTRLPVGGSA